jgi:hypothetical protein
MNYIFASYVVIECIFAVAVVRDYVSVAGEIHDGLRAH